MRKLPVKLKDRYAALENYKKLVELNEFRRRKMATHEVLNNRLELERLKGHVSAQRMDSLRHVGPRLNKLINLIGKFERGYY